MNPPHIPEPIDPAPTEDPLSEAVEVNDAASAIEALLRNPRRLMQALPTQRKLITPLILLTILSAGVLGLVLGSYSAGTQLWAAPLKVGGGLILSALICFPSLYVFSCLANSPLRLTGIAAGYLCFLALLGLLLVAFAPILWIFTQSSNSLPFVGILSQVVWLLSFMLAGGLLRKINPSAKSPWQVRLWLMIFLTVTLQMCTALRPIIGTSPDFLPQEKKFFLTHWLDSTSSEEQSDEAEDSSNQANRRTQEKKENPFLEK